MEHDLWYNPTYRSLNMAMFKNLYADYIHMTGMYDIEYFKPKNKSKYKKNTFIH